MGVLPIHSRQSSETLRWRADSHTVRTSTGRATVVMTMIGMAMLTTACSDSGEPAPASDVPAPSMATSTPVSTTELSTTTTIEPAEPGWLALWPEQSEVFTSPRAAAEDFVVRVLRVPPELGDFMAGDSRSGEIEVFSPGDPPSGRGLLLMRQLGPSSGWFVIGTINDSALITSPVTGQSVLPGPVMVQGLGEGFEATVIVEAFVVGRAEQVLDRKVTYAGNLGIAGPFEVTLDLSAAAPGDTVLILVRGGVGLETDPGEFGAIVVEIVS